MRCVECGAETADPVAPCARCGAPVVGHLSVIADPAAGAVGGAAAMATVASAAGQALPEPYVPGRGDKMPARIRRVRRGICGWLRVRVSAAGLSGPGGRLFR